MSNFKRLLRPFLVWFFLVVLFGVFASLLPVVARFVLQSSLGFIGSLSDSFALVVGGVLVGGACLMVVCAWLVVSVVFYRRFSSRIDEKE